MAVVPPRQLLDGLLALKPRPQRRRNLELIDKVCAALSRTEAEISVSIVGRLTQAAGGISLKAMSNKESSDYRALVEAWRSYSPSAGRRDGHSARGIPIDRLLAGIADPALRALVQGVSVERDKLKGEVSLLKAAVDLQVDLQPQLNASPTVVIAPLDLKPSQRSALEQAISPAFLLDMEWEVGSHGEIRNGHGRKIFEVGFVTALRNVLDATE